MADQIVTDLTARATSDTSLLSQVIDVATKTLTGAAANEYFTNSDMRLAAGLGALGGAAGQGYRANKRIETAAATGVAQKFKFGIM